MSMKDIEIVLKKVQISRASHQKNLKVLENIYNEFEHHEFVGVLAQCFRSIFVVQNEFSERTLEFLAQFVSHMTSPDETEDELSEEIQPHPFLTDITIETLKYHNLVNETLRFNACLFMRLILHHIGSKIQLDNAICDLIQDAMLERTMDSKSNIRHQAVMALVRLQDPSNPECPVINAYLSLIIDGNPLIRAETVKIIAPYIVTIPHIIKRLQDVDANVRIMALRRCADIGPKSFKIVERQHVLRCGVNEENKKVKNVFVDNLLVKWLSAYNHNYIDFLKAVKLDADEHDIITTEKISKDVMKVILGFVPLVDVIKVLPVNENKIIPVQNLTSENTIFWNVLTSNLKDSDDMEDYLDQILPELTPLCSYIEGFITYKTQSIIEEWQHLEYQQILFNLFEIVECHDFSDEVGRKNIIELMLWLLKNQTLEFRLLKKVMKLLDQLQSRNVDFTTNICHIISEIREPLIEKPASQPEDPNREFQKARLKVQLNVMESQLEDATDLKDFLKAHAVEQEILKIKKELEELSVPPPVIEVAKVSKDDPKTLCRCLDILIALLQLPSVKALTPSLVTVKDEFVLHLLNNSSVDVNWRVLNCIALFCLIDKTVAEEYIKVLTIPIVTYRAITNCNKLALLTSVKAMSDLFRIYGLTIFGEESNRTEESNITTSTMNTTKRRLYRNDGDDNTLNDLTNFNFESVIEVILDMLDDENPEIRECSVIAIAKLIRGNFPVTPPIITRMILKWYNPLTGKGGDGLQQILGGTIGNFANNVKGAKEILAKAVIPIISAVATAPKTSPLADVDVDNLLKFLSVLTNNGKDMDVVVTHFTLAHIICHEILKKKNSHVIPYLTKMLMHLDTSNNLTAIEELLQKVELILEEVHELDRVSLKNLKRFADKLKSSQLAERNASEVNVANETNETTETNAENRENATENTIDNEIGNATENTTENAEVENTPENIEEQTLQKSQNPCTDETNEILKECNGTKRRRINGSTHSVNGENDSVNQPVIILNREIEKRLSNSFGDSTDEIIDTSLDVSARESSSDSSSFEENGKRKKRSDPSSPRQQDKRQKKMNVCINEKASRMSLRVKLKKLSVNSGPIISSPSRRTRQSPVTLNGENITVTLQKNENRNQDTPRRTRVESRRLRKTTISDRELRKSVLHSIAEEIIETSQSSSPKSRSSTGSDSPSKSVYVLRTLRKRPSRYIQDRTSDIKYSGSPKTRKKT